MANLQAREYDADLWHGVSRPAMISGIDSALFVEAPVKIVTAARRAAFVDDAPMA